MLTSLYVVLFALPTYLLAFLLSKSIGYQIDDVAIQFIILILSFFVFNIIAFYKSIKEFDGDKVKALKQAANSIPLQIIYILATSVGAAVFSIIKLGFLGSIIMCVGVTLLSIYIIKDKLQLFKFEETCEEKTEV